MRFLALCLALVPALAAPLSEPGSSDGINGYGRGNDGYGLNGNGNGNNGNGLNGNGNGNNGIGLNGNGNGGNNGIGPNSNGNGGSGGSVCAAGLLYTQAQCCSTGLLDLADLDCKPAPRSFSGINDFKAACASENRSGKCCTIPIAGLALVCQDIV